MKYFRATIPLPIADNAGVPFLKENVDWFEDRLLQIGGGFRKHLRAHGVWNGDGRAYEEPVLIYEATVEASQIPELKAFLGEARAVFRQEALLVELTRVGKILFSAETGSRSGSLVASEVSR